MTENLIRLIMHCGLSRASAVELTRMVQSALDGHDSMDTSPVEIDDYARLQELDEIDDVTGMADALGALATALINIEDATVNARQRV